MEKRRSNKISMFFNVETLLTNRSAILNPIAGYAAYNAEYIVNTGKLKGYTEIKQYDIRGNTEDKVEAREKLIQFIMDGCSRLIAISLLSSNNVLIKEAKYTLTDLRQFDENELIDAAQAIRDRLQTNLTALAVYGITTTTQANFSSAISTYSNACRKFSAAQIARKANNQKIDDAIAAVDLTLKKIDIIVNMLRYSHPDFFKEYWMTRHIGKKGIRYTSFIGQVNDFLTKTFIKGVSITFELDPSSENYQEGLAPIIKRSAKKGGFYIKNIKAGIYLLTAKKHGYKDKQVRIVINKGETTRLTIEMEKIALS